MAYRIDFERPLEHEVRRIAAHQISEALDLLKRQQNGPHEAVHDARKCIKRARALYRLIRPEAGEFAGQQDDRLGNIAGELAHLRDVAALVEAAHYLQAGSTAKPESQALGHIARTLEKERDHLSEHLEKISATIATAIGALDDARQALSRLSLTDNRKKTADCLSRGWQLIDEKARKALALCTEATDDVPFHSLRKRSQDRWMHAMLLRALWPTAMIAIGHDAKALVDLLGHEHDLAVLAGQLAAPEFPNSDVDKQAALLAVARERQTLQRASLDAGRHLFDKKPQRDAEIVALLINHL